MRSYIFRVVLPVILLLSSVMPTALFNTAIAASELRATSELPKLEAKLSPLLVKELDQLAADDYVEALVLLKEQADTVTVAAEAQKLLPVTATPPERKMAGRQKVISILKDTAARTQRPMISYLAGEHLKSNVEEFKSFYIVNIVYVRAKVSVIENLALRPEVDKILPNAEVKLIEPVNGANQTVGELGQQNAGSGATPLSSDIGWNIEHIRAPEVWDNYDLDGSGVVVGIIDTGAQWDHEALKEKWRGYDPNNPHNPNALYNWLDVVGGAPMAYDDSGHGTHVAGTILGSGPDSSNRIGVAPGAQWIAVKAFDASGSGSGADLLTAGEYMLAPYDPADPDNTADPLKAPHIINNSWSGESGLDEWYREMVQSWRAAGIFPVFAAGNEGPGAGSITIPANYPESFAVAATKSNDELADFSSRGPAPYAYPEIYQPLISAPGESIRSALPGNDYDYSCGTSMAAPHITGVAALLLQSDPNLTPVELENKIINSAQPLTDHTYPVSPNFGYGYGLVDAYAAISADATAPPLPPPPYPDETAFAWNVESLGNSLDEGPISVTRPSGVLDIIKAESALAMTGADFVENKWYAVSKSLLPAYILSIVTAVNTAWSAQRV